ncbi:MAG TPA: type II toxin-antitoxin system HicA family toxin [bacterium]|nr:type II toxin-antitoxin system HicA family toxin [bacterium]
MKLLEQAGAVFDREGRGDHIIYKREVGGKLLKAPVLESKKELPPEYSLMVFKQLGITDDEINKLVSP